MRHRVAELADHPPRMRKVWYSKLTPHSLFSYRNYRFQRYAYSPLVDGDSEDEDEGVTTTKTKLTENVKRRGDKSGGYEKLDQEDKMV